MNNKLFFYTVVLYITLTLFYPQMDVGVDVDGWAKMAAAT